ncbi:MAG: prepilin-type N-terminal cleavage/methylation domain-containing protein [Paraglaciecola sp.]|jgi:prepilin-type N-terminal cleavage/methylation domain-containing protein
MCFEHIQLILRKDSMKKSQQGFTLIELVIVMVILGILSAVAVPKFVDISADARDATAQGVAAAISTSYSINYGAKLVGNASAISINTATECTVANLNRFTDLTLIAGTTALIAAAAAPDGGFSVLTTQVGVCTAASVDAGTQVPCEIAAHGGSKAVSLTVICTKV